MLSVSEALDAVLQHARALPSAWCPLERALCCALAEDVIAEEDSPPFDKALVDGYAVRSADLGGTDRTLGLGEVVPAGRTPTRALGQREAALVMTGAPIPPGCDAVVMQERVRSLDGVVVVLEDTIRRGQNLLPRGKEMKAGEVVAARGSILAPARLGVVASVGRAAVQVVPRPRVSIVPTGDELVEPGETPGPGQIRNSNAVMLHGLVVQGGAWAESLPIAPDDPPRLREILGRGLDADLLLVTGGVSTGQYDLVPATLESLGARRIFHKVRLKPGKPLWFGIGPPRSDRPGALVFGLPGNPVSGLVSFLLFVRPALAALAGKERPGSDLREATLARGFSHRGDRTTYFPSRLVDRTAGPPDRPCLETLDWSGSADLRTVAQADGFAVFPAGDRDYASGETVGFLPMERYPT
ncbi:MAG: gephyrin-like molybdotransferase Glp [Isosphaerales bacterium]